jgi:glycosyltransferase involved in cell wall biosynthesis
MHFTFQVGFITDVPSIYHPHDLQHLHLPQFFSREDRAWRERWYRELCAQAALVAVASSWTKRDVELSYGIEPAKIEVVPLAPPTLAYPVISAAAIEATHARLATPPAYVLYPAQTWPHKNHVNLLRALALLRRRHGLVVPLVACGQQNEGFPELAREQGSLGLGDQVVWPGFVSPADLQALYARATAVVIPSKFEAASAPLWEAFAAGVPAACSDVTSLPEQAGDAALLFDPDDVEQIAESIRRIWTEADLRAILISRGAERVKEFTWSRTAHLFRAHYRRVARVPLTGADRELIASKVAI